MLDTHLDLKSRTGHEVTDAPFCFTAQGLITRRSDRNSYVSAQEVSTLSANNKAVVVVLRVAGRSFTLNATCPGSFGIDIVSMQSPGLVCRRNLFGTSTAFLVEHDTFIFQMQPYTTITWFAWLWLDNRFSFPSSRFCFSLFSLGQKNNCHFSWCQNYRNASGRKNEDPRE